MHATNPARVGRRSEPASDRFRTMVLAPSEAARDSYRMYIYLYLYILCALTQFRSLAPNNSHRPKLLEDLAPEEVREQVRRHIFTTMGHFRGRIKVWDVVNEALAPNGEFRCIGFGDDAEGRL